MQQWPTFFHLLLFFGRRLKSCFRYLNYPLNTIKEKHEYLESIWLQDLKSDCIMSRQKNLGRAQMLIVVVDVSTSKWWWWWSFVIIIFSLEEKNGSRSVPVKMHAMPGNNNAWYKCLSKGFYFSIRPWQSFLYCLRQVDMTSNNVRSHRCHKSAPHIAWGGKNDQVWPKQVAHCDAKLKPLTVICLVLRGDEHLSIAPLCGSFCPFPAHRKEVKTSPCFRRSLLNIAP